MATPAITFVTGSSNKLAEARAILPFDIRSATIDVEEIQSLDPEEIVTHKLREAYKHVGSPVIVDDVAAGLESLNGLPGPFIKFFEQKLGDGALYKLSKTKDDNVTIICCLGYYDGSEQIIVKGVLHGKLAAPRGSNGFGFDKVVVPNGQSRTMAEMSNEEKNTLSHRFLALTLLATELAKH